MTQAYPEGPTEPGLAAAPVDDESTTIVPQVGYVVPPMPTSPPGPAAADRAGGSLYSTGERRYDPVPDPDAERGRTTIADEVVERVIGRIVDLAAEEVAGVHALHAGSGDGADRPVSVQLDGDRAVIDIAIEAEFGHPLHEVVENVRRTVISQSERLLGLTVAEVNVLVAQVSFDSTG